MPESELSQVSMGENSICQFMLTRGEDYAA
jgi:hypothetical protein